jgi:hypothetical protein
VVSASPRSPETGTRCAARRRFSNHEIAFVLSIFTRGFERELMKEREYICFISGCGVCAREAFTQNTPLKKFPFFKQCRHVFHARRAG